MRGDAGGERLYDIAIIGGGINGCGIARDAAGRGYAVFLCEQDDLASGTSSRSTKLIHGGLRYLERYDLRLVHEALKEREVLWRVAPHLVRPLRFVLPHQRGLRPAWMLRLGLFLYDHLGGRQRLPATRTLDLRTDAAGRPLKAHFTTAFEYSDCWVDDARLVVLNARDAAERGAVISTRSRAIAAERVGALWRLSIAADEGIMTLSARALVNAAGPWVETVDAALGIAPSGHVRLVEGSHIVVPALFEHERAYIFQNPDGRIVFAIPFEEHFTLIGTTDRDYLGEPGAAVATEEEIAYLCAAASACFARRVGPADVVWSYSGVRPLFDDGRSDAKAASRDYVLKTDEKPGAAPLVTVIGGKITVYRRLAEAVLQRLERHLRPSRPESAGRPAGWTGEVPLPGGEFDVSEVARLAQRLVHRFPFLAPAQALRLVRAYGTRAARVLGNARSEAELGRQFGAGLSEAEVRYLIAEEWATTGEDVLWRRSKLGLRLSQPEAAALDAFVRAASPGGQLTRAAEGGGGP